MSRAGCPIGIVCRQPSTQRATIVNRVAHDPPAGAAARPPCARGASDSGRSPRRDGPGACYWRSPTRCASVRSSPNWPAARCRAIGLTVAASTRPARWSTRRLADGSGLIAMIRRSRAVPRASRSGNTSDARERSTTWSRRTRCRYRPRLLEGAAHADPEHAHLGQHRQRSDDLPERARDRERGSLPSTSPRSRRRPSCSSNGRSRTAWQGRPSTRTSRAPAPARSARS